MKSSRPIDSDGTCSSQWRNEECVQYFLVRKPGGKRPLGKRRHRWEDNIRMGLREVGLEILERMHLAQDRN
jgi:hypothetical protein